MTEYIVNDTRFDVNATVIGYERREEIVRCRDCKHATVSSLGYVKYCEMFVLPDEDGYGADPQVRLPLGFFCGYGEPRGDAE